MKTHNPQPITILGAGSWGTAVALHLAKQLPLVRLWSYSADDAAIMQKERANNRYLPGLSFPDNIEVTDQLTQALAGNCDIIIAVPSVGFREILTKLKPLIQPSTRIAWLTKGMDLDTGQLLHSIAKEILGEDRPYAVISGPSFAREVAAGLPTALVIASTQTEFGNDLMHQINSPYFRVYPSTDMVGVEVGGIVKNVIAIAAGITDGMQLGANARCALITRGLAEITRLGVALGGEAETFTGLSGLGDLVLTCSDNQSRNRRFGLLLGSGKTFTEATKEIGQVIEGKRNAELVMKMAKQHNVEMPITEIVSDILQEKITIKEGMQKLLSRPIRN